MGSPALLATGPPNSHYGPTRSRAVVQRQNKNQRGRHPHTQRRLYGNLQCPDPSGKCDGGVRVSPTPLFPPPQRPGPRQARRQPFSAFFHTLTNTDKTLSGTISIPRPADYVQFLGHTCIANRHSATKTWQKAVRNQQELDSNFLVSMPMVLACGVKRLCDKLDGSVADVSPRGQSGGWKGRAPPRRGPNKPTRLLRIRRPCDGLGGVVLFLVAG